MVPTDLRYTKDHEWVRLDGDEAIVGITAYAAEQLGDIVFVELPEVGRTLDAVRGLRRRRVGQGRQRPVRPGRRRGRRRRTTPWPARPELVNSDPYGEGWMVRLRVADPAAARRAARRRRLRRAHRGGLTPPMPYGPHTAGDRERMLAALGHRLGRRALRRHPGRRSAPRALDLPAARARAELAGAPAAASPARNRVDLASFLGAGVYRHYSPPAVDQILLRGEWYTAYTPYQPEISQGTLQSIYEYESLIAELIGLDVVSASHYDGAAATAEAALMTCRATRRERVLVSRGRPSATTARRSRRTSRRRPRARRDPARRRRAGGRHDRPRRARAAARRAGSPGRRASSPPSRTSSACSSRWPTIGALAHAAGALFVAVVEPVSLAVLAPPGAYGADIAAGEGQPLGIAPQYGGPYLGILASTDALVRQIPGRLVGMTTDLDGQRAFVMTLRAREQDIRRDKAASNICTNQALLALAASRLPRDDRAARPARRRGAGGAARAAELEAALAAVGAPRLHPGPYLNEFAVRVPDAPAVHRRLLEHGVLAGLVLADAMPDDPSLADGLLVCATEVTTRDEIARFADGARRASSTAARRSASRPAPATDGAARPRGRAMSVTGPRLQPTLFERVGPGRGGGKIPHPPEDALDRIPAGRAAGDAAGAARAQRARGRPPLRQPLAAQLRGRHRASTRSARAR